jgi:hypothetical protein
MKTKPTLKMFTKLPLLLASLLLASCGSYEMTTPITSSQEISKISGVPAVSGKPALRTPAKIGVVTTGRTDSIDFGSIAKDMEAGARISSLQPINSFIPEREYYQLNDVLTKRAKLIHDTRFLGLDVILVCDQQTQSDRSPSLLGVATLGILDAGLRKQDTQLTVLCMDARTGYIYGVMGRQEDGHTARLSLFDNNVFGNPDRSHLVQTTRREAVKGFPEFWKQLVDKYER